MHKCIKDTFCSGPPGAVESFYTIPAPNSNVLTYLLTFLLKRQDHKLKVLLAECRWQW